MAAQFTSSRRQRAPAIWHPLVDFLLVGGASVIGGGIMIVWFAYNPDWLAGFNRFADTGSQPRDLNNVYLFWLLTLLINHPHFMASYRLLYRSKKQIRTYRWSSVWIRGTELPRMPSGGRRGRRGAGTRTRSPGQRADGEPAHWCLLRQCVPPLL